MTIRFYFGYDNDYYGRPTGHRKTICLNIMRFIDFRLSQSLDRLIAEIPDNIHSALYWLGREHGVSGWRKRHMMKVAEMTSLDEIIEWLEPHIIAKALKDLEDNVL